MIVNYSKRGSLCEAIAQTFDGAHPCSLCHIVNKGKTTEKKSDLQLLTPKIDMICTKRAIRWSGRLRTSITWLAIFQSSKSENLRRFHHQGTPSAPNRAGRQRIIVELRRASARTAVRFLPTRRGNMRATRGSSPQKGVPN